MVSESIWNPDFELTRLDTLSAGGKVIGNLKSATATSPELPTDNKDSELDHHVMGRKEYWKRLSLQ